MSNRVVIASALAAGRAKHRVRPNPHATELLTEIASHYPILIHTVGASIGSANGIDRYHLRRMRGLFGLIDPILVSGHTSSGTHPHMSGSGRRP